MPLLSCEGSDLVEVQRIESVGEKIVALFAHQSDERRVSAVDGFKVRPFNSLSRVSLETSEPIE